MTKSELMEKYNKLLEKKKIYALQNLNGKIGWNSKRAIIENAIKCLEASDDEMLKKFENCKKECPNTCKNIAKAGNFLNHSFNRLYIYNL